MLELKNISFTRDNKKILDDINLKLDDDKFEIIFCTIRKRKYC